MSQSPTYNRVRSRSVLTQFREDPIGFLRHVATLSSGSRTFRIAGRTLHLIKDAEAIEELLVNRQTSFKKGPGLQRLKPLLGDGLLTVDSARHERRRRRLQPAFSAQSIGEHAGKMPAIIDGFASSWKPGGKIEVHREMTRLTLAVVAQTLFNNQDSPDHRQVGSAISDNLTALYRPLKNSPHCRKSAGNGVDRLVDVVASVVGGHRSSLGSADLLSLIDAGDYTATEKHDEILTFLLGGHESVATALTWTWYALSQYPDVRERFEAEVDDCDLSQAAPVDLPFTGSVIAESLRLFPPAWMFTREAIEDVEIGGIRFPSRSILIAAPCVIHRDPRYWSRPDQFDPDRWNSDEASERPKYAYFPFGGGARRCIGERFALTELAVALASPGEKMAA